jgi:hypothetical protein
MNRPIQPRRILAAQMAGEIAVIVTVSSLAVWSGAGLLDSDAPVAASLTLAVFALFTVVRILRYRLDALINQIEDWRISQ